MNNFFSFTNWSSSAKLANFFSLESFLPYSICKYLGTKDSTSTGTSGIRSVIYREHGLGSLGGVSLTVSIN